MVDIGVTIACGLSVTVKENTAPMQLPEVGVTIYVAVTTPFVVLVKVPVRVLKFPAWVAPPVNPIPVGALQLYVVPAGTIP